MGDFVWNDANGNGIQDAGESGLENIEVQLLNASQVIIDTVLTDSTGNYLFNAIQPGNYYLEFVLPFCHDFSPAHQGGDDTLDSDPDPISGRTDMITVLPQSNDNSIDAGMSYKCSSLGDYVWHDDDLDGVQDVTEVGFENVEIHLLDSTFTQIENCVTDSNGLYQFDYLLPGDYYLEFVVPTGFVFSPLDQGGDDTLDSDADPVTGRTAMIVLAAGIVDMSRDAGMVLIDNSLGDYVWVDTNENGIQDAGETGCKHVQVNLLDIFWAR